MNKNYFRIEAFITKMRYEFNFLKRNLENIKKK